MTKLRRATTADAEACRDVALAAYSPYLERMEVRPQPMDADYADAVEHLETWVLQNGGTVVAYVVLDVQPDHLGVDNVAVRPDRQRHGLGRRLMAHAETRAAELGLPRLRLHTHVTMVENQALYERLGYAEIHRGSVGPWQRVFYEKDLTIS